MGNVSRFVIIISERNASRWIARNLFSIFDQNKKDCRILITDDASDDGTGEIIKTIKKHHPCGNQIELIENKERKKLCANHINMLSKCDDDDIAVFLDGDDWFPHPRGGTVLGSLNEIYKDSAIWTTYGSYEYDEVSSYPGKCNEGATGQMSEKAHHRRVGFLCGALRTVRVWLFRKIKEEDLKLGDDWIFPCSDLAIMFPIIEMAGPKHACYIPKTTYIYNRFTPNPVSRIDEGRRQRQIYAHIINKRPYAQLRMQEDESTYLEPIPAKNKQLKDYLRENPLKELEK